MRRAHPRCCTGLGMTETVAVRDLRQRPRRQVGPHRPAGARRRAEAGAERRQDRGALPRPERHARLLARARADGASRFDDEGFYCSGDAVQADGPGRPRARPHVRRPHRRGLQALDRHLRLASARCARRSSPPATRACRTSSSPASTATRSACCSSRASTPAARFAGLPADAPPHDVLRARRRCATFFQRLVDALCAERHRQRQPRRARARAAPSRRRSTGRGHRQGLDQPARRAAAPRRAGRAPVRRRRRDLPLRADSPTQGRSA